MNKYTYIFLPCFMWNIVVIFLSISTHSLQVLTIIITHCWRVLTISTHSDRLLTSVSTHLYWVITISTHTARVLTMHSYTDICINILCEKTQKTYIFSVIFCWDTTKTHAFNQTINCVKYTKNLRETLYFLCIFNKKSLWFF